MKVSRNLAIYSFIELGLSIMLLLSIFLNDASENIVNIERRLGIYTIINLIITIVFITKIRKEYFSISILFIVFLYVFNLGIPVARLFGWITYDGELFLNRRIYSMGYNTFIEYSFYAFLLITFLQIGLIYYYTVKNKKRIKENLTFDHKKYEFQLQQCVLVGKILVVIGIIPYILQEFLQIKNSLIYGYQNAENTFSLSGTGIGIMGGVIYVAIILLLYGYQKNPKKFNIIFLTMCVYQIFRMYVTGDRSTGIALIFIFLLIRHKFVSPIKGKKIILYCILVYILMIFIKLVELTRNIDSLSAKEVLYELLQTNMIAETIFEYGGNVWCGIMVYYSIPMTGTYRFGLTYLAAIIGKPFQILGITSSIWTFADFSNFLTQPERGALINSLTAAMGGSFSGEWYFNFGWIGILIIPLFGYVLGWFSDACVDKNRNPILSAFLLYVATLVIWWVRQYFTSVIWNTLVYGVLIYLIYEIILKKYRYKKG